MHLPASLGESSTESFGVTTACSVSVSLRYAHAERDPRRFVNQRVALHVSDMESGVVCIILSLGRLQLTKKGTDDVSQALELNTTSSLQVRAFSWRLEPRGATLATTIFLLLTMGTQRGIGQTQRGVNGGGRSSQHCLTRRLKSQRASEASLWHS